MTPRDQKKKRRPSAQARLRVMNPHAAGIDVHANVHWVAVPAADAPAPPPDHPPNLPAHVRSFGACTADLLALADWLTTCHVRTVVMESTGIYWILSFELLESRGFEVLLVEPRQSRHAPGWPKSDVLDLTAPGDCTTAGSFFVSARLARVPMIKLQGAVFW